MAFVTSSTPDVRSDQPFSALRTIDLRGRELSPAELKAAMPRAGTSTDTAAAAVTAIIDDVRTRGFAALADLASKFDGVEQVHPLVPREALRAALDGLDPEVRAGLEESIRRQLLGEV